MSNVVTGKARPAALASGADELVALNRRPSGAGALFTAYWFAYRPHLPYEESARYRNTSSLIMPTWLRPLEWFWLGQNLHSVHHLFPRVPFYRHHALHRRIEPAMQAHGTPIIGMLSRKAVPEGTEAGDR